MKQWDMAKNFADDPRVRFFIGGVKDRERMYRALDGVDYVVHAAATKIVPTAKYNPLECVKTNINGAMNLIDAGIDKSVKGVVALSTDKASSPLNLYGATKLASDKLFVAGNHYAGAKDIRFSVVRYGNVMGLGGSVIPFFMSIKDQGVLPITDNRMTRFMIFLDQAVKLVWHAFEDMVGGVNLHCIPVHIHLFYQELGFKLGDFPEADKYYGQAISIPLFHGLKDDAQDLVIDAITEMLA